MSRQPVRSETRSSSPVVQGSPPHTTDMTSLKGLLLLGALASLVAGQPAIKAGHQDNSLAPPTRSGRQRTETDSEPLSAERCFDSDSPLWCLAEETSASLGRAFYPAAGSGSPAGSDPLALVADLASQIFQIEPQAENGLDQGESRARRRRRFAYFFVAIASVLAIILPIKLKAIALMAATALVIGKIALIIASLVGLKKLVHKPSEETTHVHYSGHRSDPDSHYLAYSEHVPQYPQEGRK